MKGNREKHTIPMTPRQRPSETGSRYTLPALVILTCFAAALRLYRLGTLPGGLHHDEASNGMLALDILNGSYPIFFSAYTGKEAGFMYLVALSITLFGKTIFAIRLPAALAGAALVPALFLAGRRAIGTRGALLASGAAAVAPWLLHINRIGFRATLLPLLLTLWVWLLLRALADNRPRDWIGAGLLLGLSAYTYTSSRIVPLLLLLFVAYLLLWHRPLIRQCWRGLTHMLLAAMLITTPLAIYYLRHPADWSERLEQIGACANMSPGICGLTIGKHLLATLGMIGYRGDPIGFFNLPEAPALPIIAGWLFYIGILIALTRLRQPAIALILLWWFVLILPGVLSQDSPHFLRTIGAAPPTMLLWALPFTLKHPIVLTRHALRINTIIAAIFFMTISSLSIHDYFWTWATQPERYYDYMGYATDAAHTAEQIAPDIDLFISEEYYRHPTYLYLAPRTSTAHWFDARFGVPVPRPEKTGVYLISPATPVDQRINSFLHGATGENILNEQGLYSYTRLETPILSEEPGTMMPPTKKITATVGTLKFAGLTATRSSSHLLVTLFWKVQHPTQRNLRVFLHLVDTQGNIITQHDVAGYPSQEWRAGDRFATFHTLTLPAQIEPDGVYTIAVGLYDVVNGERMPVQATESRENAVMVYLDEWLVPEEPAPGLDSP